MRKNSFTLIVVIVYRLVNGAAHGLTRLSDALYFAIPEGDRPPVERVYGAGLTDHSPPA